MKPRNFLVLLFVLLACAARAGSDTCFDCHQVMEGMSLIFTNDIHFTKAISCVTCHGGDATETNQNISMNASRGFKVRITRQGVPQFCGSCHGDASYMGKYKSQPRVDQLEKYQAGVHGRSLAAGHKHAAECVDCHRVHDIRAVDDPLSAVSPQRISKTCAKCHAATGEALVASRHGKVFMNARRPGCTTCHAGHDTAPASTAMLVGATSVCARCHKPGSPPMKLAADMAQILTRLEAAGPAAKDSLAQARIAVHSLNLSMVKKAAEPAPDASNAHSN